jgi:hypothetical protein
VFVAIQVNATIDNATIAHNTSNDEGGGIRNDGTLSLTSTLVADNISNTTSATDLSDAGTASATDSIVQNGSGNSVTNGSNGNQVGVLDSDLNLNTSLTTASNGTNYLGFSSTSVAFGAGTNPDNLTTDQIGNARVVNGQTDVGAIETGGAIVPVSVVAISTQNGFVELVNSDTGHIYQSFQPFGATFKGVVEVALGDVNGDGVPNLIVSTHGAFNGQVMVFDGAAAIESGVGFSNSSTWANGSGSILPDGESTPLLATLTPFAGYKGGFYVASGDVNNDGHSDIIVGTSAGGVTRVAVFSGANPSVQLGNIIIPFGTQFTGGATVAAGDVTGNGFADVIVGSASEMARIKVYSLMGNAFDQVGSTINPFSKALVGVEVAAVDVNGSGVSDIAIGILNGGTAQVAIVDGSGNQLARYTAGKHMSAFAIGEVDPGDSSEESLLFSGISIKPKQIEILAPLTGAELSSLNDIPTLIGGIALDGC